MNAASELHQVKPEDLIDAEASRLRLSAPAITLRPQNGSRLVFVTEPNGVAVEQYKLLRRRLCAMSPRGGLLLVTSPGPGEGKTLTSVNLAWCMAEGGPPTCLVDLDLRAPGVGATLGYEPTWGGVDEILSGKSTISDVIRQVGSRPLYVLGVRERLPAPTHHFAPSNLLPLLKELQDTFEWVIIDMAPAIPMSDVAEVLPYVDGALMVVRSDVTAKSLVGPTFELLGSKLWGVVLNDAPVSGSSYYGHYGYGYAKLP